MGSCGTSVISLSFSHVAGFNFLASLSEKMRPDLKIPEVETRRSYNDCAGPLNHLPVSDPISIQKF